MSGKLAARLEFVDNSTEPPTKETFPLLVNQTIKFGRDEMSNDYVILDLAVSRNHLEFYSIQFDENAEPMIYVRDRQSSNGTYVNDFLIGEGNRISTGRLLKDGDEVAIKPNWSFRVAPTTSSTVELSDIQQLETKLFADEYTVTNKILGEGISTMVRLAYEQKTGRQLACKIYDLKRLRDAGATAEVEKVMRSVFLGPQIEHPNVTSFERAYKSPYSVYVFEELASGGDLFALMNRVGEFKDLEVRWMMCQILKGLAYLHIKGVAHRDIKLENVLCMVCPKPAHRLAITDFGHAGLMAKGRRRSMCGTLGLQAPEQLTNDGSHDVAVDMWAVGIVAVQLLAGNAEMQTLEDLEHSLPADPQNIDLDKIFSELRRVRNFRSWTDSEHRREPTDRTLSESAEDFVRRCLRIDERERMTASEALNHPWMREPDDDSELFHTREKEIGDGWDTRKVQDDLIRDLHDVLNPPKKDRPQYKIRPVRPLRQPVGLFEGSWGPPPDPSTESSYKLPSYFPKQAEEDRKKLKEAKRMKKRKSSEVSVEVEEDRKKMKDAKRMKERKSSEISVEAEMATAAKMSEREWRKNFGKHGRLGDISIGGCRPSLERHLSPRTSQHHDERRRDKEQLLATLKEKGVSFLPRNMTWPMRATAEPANGCSSSSRSIPSSPSERVAKRARSDDGSDDRAGKRKKIVIDEDTGRPINFDDP